MSDERRLDRLTPDRELFGNFARRMVATLDERDFLRAQVDHLCAELAVLRESARWIPVGERLPDESDCDLWGRVLVSANRNDGWVGPAVCKDGRFTTMPGNQPVMAAYWLRLPTPPEPQAVQEVPNV